MTTKARFPFYKRLFIFFNERFPLHIYIPFVVFLYLSMSFSIQALQSHNVVIDDYTYVGLASSLLFMLLIRMFDELKDYELDKKIFPNRPVSRGDVLKSDLHLIAIFTFISLVAINIFFAQKTLLVFGIVMIYALLTFKWFFAKRLHLNNIFLTMFTHQPLPYLINFYLLHTALASGTSYENFTSAHFTLLMFFSIPITIWETSRKIRNKEKEDDYQTFSRVLGSSGAAFIPLIAVLITMTLSFYTGLLLNLDRSFFIITILSTLYAVIFYIRFIINPSEKNNNLETTATVFSLLVSLNLIIHLLFIINIIII